MNDDDQNASEQVPDELIESTSTALGYVFGETFDATLVEYSVVGDRAMFEGDIVLGTLAEMEARRALVEGQRAAAPADPSQTTVEAVVIPGQQFRWPDGVVPYEIDSGLPATQVAAVNGAVQHWTSQSRLRLVQRTSQNETLYPDWVRFVPGTGCSSPVGRQGSSQDVHLATGCFFGQAVHELGHSIGLWHEQSREDRDDFVTVQWANIQDGQAHNFDQHISDGDDVGPYDFGSIMHYSGTAFSKNNQPTIVAKQTLPAGVTMGQRNGLSAGDRAGVRSIYPDLEPSTRTVWLGDFTGSGQTELLYYLRSRRDWYLGSWQNGSLQWTLVSNTDGFGQVGDGRPFWVGDWDGDGRDEILFYYPGDGNWWLGRVVAGSLGWSLVSNTSGSIPGDPNFGAFTDGRPVWTGRFTAADRSQVLFYYPGDDNWWLASWDPGASRFGWTFAGNSRGFGHAINDGRPFWIADLDGDGVDEVVFYYPGDGNWWSGRLTTGMLQWALIGNTLGAPRPQPGLPAACRPLADRVDGVRGEIAGLQEDLQTAAPGEKPAIVRQIRALQSQLRPLRQQLDDCIQRNSPPPPRPWPDFGQVADGRPFWVGRFSRSDRAELLFHYPGDGNWWLGTFDGGELVWTWAGNTTGFGQVADGRPFFVADFTGDGRDDIAFYYPGDDNWFIGSHGNGQLQWSFAGNTAGFGHGINDGRPFWAAPFSAKDRGQVLFYFPGDGNWWLATRDTAELTWALVATFES